MPPPAVCGDGIVDALAGESCDDGNLELDDDCPDGPGASCQPASCSDGFWHRLDRGEETDIDCGGSTCAACPGVLLLSEIAVTPTLGEFIELFNPSEYAVSLGLVGLADYASYYSFDEKPLASDFRVRFPPGTVIEAGAHLVVALRSAADFASVYGKNPDFDFAPSDAGAPDMTGELTASSGLTNSHELVVLYWRAPNAVFVRDIDYVVYGDVSDAIDKSGVAGYGSDTAATAQQPAPAPSSTGQSLIRCDIAEGAELTSGGNGYDGDDETSENLNVTWQLSRAPSPGAANPCP